ncbi:DUF4222 domain-containing protein [Serratia sp. MF2]|uniref:DUF4222 domain-containing protein n=1 Tax=Serratia sp. MF2 TaxID=3059173 RepID=UPI0027EA8F93|nr:DUF4222 domain-containing protein [Serratia sp. MF2]MDQ7101918.1 DUF4222 domain-containing protein [Serratia sp. MF2]
MSIDPVVKLDRYYSDRRGIKVHVIGYDRSNGQVHFMRPGYEYLCALPLWYVEKYFIRLDA